MAINLTPNFASLDFSGLMRNVPSTPVSTITINPNLSQADLLASANRAASSPVLNLAGPAAATVNLPPATVYGPPSPSVAPVVAPPPVLTSPAAISAPAPTPTPMLTGASPATAATVQSPPPSAPEPVDPGLMNATVENQPRSSKPTGKIDADKVAYVEQQLKDQYNALNQYAGYEYQGKKSDLDRFFKAQASKLAANGIGDLADIGEQDGKLINKVTGENLKKITFSGNTWLEPNSTDFSVGKDLTLEEHKGYQRWGSDYSVDGQADYAINFVDGQAVMVPMWKDTTSKWVELVAPVAAIGLNFAFPGIGTAIGGALAPGASAAVQAAIGSAAVAGLTTGVVTGDMDKALIAAALAGGGSYLNATGTLGEAFDGLGLTEYKDTFGIQGGLETTAQAATKDAIQLAGQGLSEGQIGQILEQNYGLGATEALNIGKNAFDVAFAAQDALNLAGVTSDPNAIAQNLIATGVDPIVANSMANSAVTGANLSTIVSDVSSFVPTKGLFSATPTDMADFAGITTGGESLGLTADQLSAIQRGEIPGDTFAEMADAAKFIIPGTAAAGGMLDGVTDKIKDVAGDVLGDNASGLFNNLLGAGIDYATAEKIAKEASGLGRSAEATAIAAGKAADVPFTPYTVTTGAGSTAFGTDPLTGAPTATVTPSADYSALRTQALGAAGSTLGAIDPARAAESLFNRAEALAGPARERETEALLSSLGARGLLGVSRNLPTVGGTTAGVNPYLESLLSAQRTAQARTALESTQFGTVEAQRQAALANALIGTGQGIDTAALGTLTAGANLGNLATTADQTSAGRLLEATLAGQRLRLPYENIGLMTRGGALTGAADVGKSITEAAIKEIFG